MLVQGDPSLPPLNTLMGLPVLEGGGAALGGSNSLLLAGETTLLLGIIDLLSDFSASGCV